MNTIKIPDIESIIDIEPEEIWNYSSPGKGNHIRVSRGLYCHHGVYISNDEVIHFTGKDADNILDWSKNEVIKTNLNEFMRGDKLEVKEYTDDELDDLYPVEHIILYARACLGDKEYDLIFNNCEHFANTCTLGRFRSKQVERVFGGLTINKTGGNMGLFGAIGGFIKGIFGGNKSSGGSRNVSNTTYEPDKVKVAEIEADTKLRLAGMENERIELMKNTRLDILEFETQCSIAVEKAKARGLNYMVQTIVNMQERLNEVAEKRLKIIEKCSFETIKEVDGYYREIEERIESDNNKYSTEKFPKLLELLENYDIGTPAHNLYMKRIDDDMNSQINHYNIQIENINRRQDLLLNNMLQSKDRIIEQTTQITAGMMDKMIEGNMVSKSLGEGSYEQTLLGNTDMKMIEGSKQ